MLLDKYLMVVNDFLSNLKIDYFLLCVIINDNKEFVKRK